MFISCLSAGLCNLGLSPSVNNITLDEKKKKTMTHLEKCKMAQTPLNSMWTRGG